MKNEDPAPAATRAALAGSEVREQEGYPSNLRVIAKAVKS